MSDNKILIATPKVNNHMFYKSVIYIHSDDTAGAAGVILNCPMDSEMANRFAQDLGWQYPERILLGGPVDQHLGYIIHSADYVNNTSVRLNDDLRYTSGKSILTDINRGTGPHQFVLVTGYCVWQPHQLQNEIDQGMWLVTDFDIDFFFQNLNREDGWESAINIAAKSATKKILATVDIK